MFSFSIEFSPEVLIMGTVAVTIDIVGFIVLFCGLDDFGLLDMAWAMVSIPWLIFRGSRASAKQSGVMGWIQRFFTGKWSRFLGPLGVGEVPYLGNLIPLRTLSFFFNVAKFS